MENRSSLLTAHCHSWCRRVSLLLGGLLLLLSSCQNRPLYSHYTILSHSEWHRQQELFYSFGVRDTLKSYVVFASLRSTSKFPYKFLPMGVVYETADRHFSTREVQYPLSIVSQYRESHQGYDLYETTIPIDTLIFRQVGVHTFSLRPLLRDSVLPGIVEVGLIVKPLR